MSKKPPPLLGYNTNVRHKGHLFHIQTEDSGIDHPHVITHLFAAGTILATKRITYALAIEEDKLDERVRQIMKDQHKAMFIELRDGVHDEVLNRILSAEAVADQPDNRLSPSVPVRPSDTPMIDIDRPQGVRVIRPAAMNPTRKPSDPSKKTPLPAETAKGRSIFDAPDDKGEFGENLITDKSLDEVILSYLTDELD